MGGMLNQRGYYLRHGGGGDRIWCSLRLEWLTEVITTASAKVEFGQKIAGLVEKYRSLSPGEIKKFNEAMTKQGFIEPMFRALGWDFDDVNEVTPEESASKGRVDYAFKLNGVAQLYVEAKSLKADLTNPEYVKQAITYAYNKGVTWALLTDFEGLRLFNAQKNTPYINLSYQDYVARLDKLWLLSRDSLEKGLLNKEAAQDGALPLSVPIEKRLFNQLRQWREDLYNQLSGYNENLSPAQIDQAIQRLLNRLIFIRTCEDRNIEERRLLAAVHQWQSSGHKKDQLAETLRHIFHEFDGYYDSELFATHIIDSDQVFIQEPTIEGILNGLYDIPGAIASYDFSLIDADVLGQVYEQYLGYVASKTKQKLQAQMTLGIPGEALVEFSEKKQHRKEQGIYYTPKFVTNYIVKETVGRFLAERSHNEVLSMKILDPACGSGSFLIRAYDELLNYHAAQRGKTVFQLDQFDRMPVLTGNVFGIDLDRQAIEIARLNLLLRGLAKRETLPTLADNIREGNSLISGTEEELKGYFGDAWQVKKPFNWEKEFADIMKGGGFDVVIGNPPYVRIQSLPREEADYYRKVYKTASGSFDIYVLFIERALTLLKPGGRLSFITSGKFLKAAYGEKVQRMISNECTVESIVDLSAQQVFADATTYPMIMIIRKDAGGGSFKYTFVPKDIDLSKDQSLDAINPIAASQSAISKGIWPPLPADDSLLTRLTKDTTLLGGLAERIFQGLKTSADSVYTFKPVGNSGKTTVVVTQSKKRIELESGLLRPLIKGGQMHRYHIGPPKLVILFPYVDGELLSPEELEQNYHQVWLYLLENRNQLESRERGIFKGEKWYQYGRNQALNTIHLPKLITPDFAPSARFSWDNAGQYCFNGGAAGGYGVILPKTVNPLYVLGLLNSKLLDWYLHRISTTFRGGWFSYEARFIRHLPIRIIDLAKPDEKKAHDDLVYLVEKMLQLKKNLAPISDIYGYEREDLLKEIEKTDEEINNSVYDLYGLTEEERKIVETAA